MVPSVGRYAIFGQYLRYSGRTNEDDGDDMPGDNDLMSTSNSNNEPNMRLI